MIDFLQSLDEKILLAVNGWNSGFFDGIMWWISGKFSWWPLYVSIIAYLFYKKKPKEAFVVVGLIILLITLSDQTSVHFFKNTFQRLRPSHQPDLENLLHYVNDYKGGKYGFISSHATNTFSVALFLFLVFGRNWTGLILFSWAILVAYSRMYLGVHYFFDVFVGALWGGILALLVYFLYRKISKLISPES